ncbi:alpha/beta hydrolase [Frigoribacterium sp. 2-23]|uniref:alpha/beta hydrolase n=1 Tax=Frigoribacterium sp. 2-23 TaxID=3415006 RepID=UPI003C6ECBBA
MGASPDLDPTSSTTADGPTSATPIATTSAVTRAAIDGPRGAVPVRRYAPTAIAAGAAPPPLVVWLHGGGFFRGDLDQPEAHDVARSLAARGVPVVTVDYTLAPVPLPFGGRLGLGASRPRARYPAAEEDVLSAVRALAGPIPGVVIGGASAGACLAAATALRLSPPVGADERPVGLLLAYGFFHATLPRSRETQRAVRGHRRLWHAPLALDGMNRNYAGSWSKAADPAAFAGGRELDGLPPTLMVDAERDAMRASGEVFATELTEAGVDLERHVVPGTDHAFLNRPELAAFASTLDLTAAWLHRLGSGGRAGRDAPA